MSRRSAAPDRNVERDDAERHALQRNRKTQGLQLPGQLSRLGEGLHRLRQVPVRGCLVAAAQANDNRHDATEIETVRAHQQATGRRSEFKDDEAPTWAKDPQHLAQRSLSVDEVAQAERDGDGVDAAIRLAEPCNVAQAKLDMRLALAGQLEHRRREVDADHPAGWSDEREELVRELAGAGAEVERRLALAERRAAGSASAPGAVAVRAEQAVASVVSGGNLVEHLADPISPRLLPHVHDYGRLRPDPDCDRCSRGVR